MSGDDNYSWLDDHSSDPTTGTPSPAEAPPSHPPSSTGVPAPSPMTTPAPPPPSSMAGTRSPAGAAFTPPPMTGTHRDRGDDPLARKLKSQPYSGPNSDGESLRNIISYIRYEASRPKLALVIAGLIGLIVVANVVDLGTPIKRLDTGECFELPSSFPSSGKDTRVTVVDCALPHGAEVYARAGSLSADEVCIDEFPLRTDAQLSQLPIDADFAIVGGVLSRKCVLYSPSEQLVGTVFDW